MHVWEWGLVVQLRGPEAIAQRLLERAGLSQQGEPLQGACPADALLLVSGSHALRPALSWTGALQVQSSLCLADIMSTTASLGWMSARKRALCRCWVVILWSDALQPLPIWMR